MSYYFQMAFANAKTEVEAYSIAHSFVNGISLEQMKAYIDDNFLFVPSVKYSMGKKLKDKTFSDLADKYWLYGLFNYRFVFWPKFHLLGLLGSSESTSFGRVISFQNSTDQDYDWDEWPNNIPYFKERVFATKQALKNGNANFFGEDNDEFDEDTDIEYRLKSELYRKIFDELCLNDWLYGKDNKVFRRFCINGITSSEMLLKLHLILVEQKRKIVKEI